MAAAAVCVSCRGAILSRRITHTLTHVHRVAQAGTLSLPRWAEDKNSISCWLLLQKCAFLGDLSPQGGWRCFIAALRCCALFLFRFPFFQAQTHTHSHAHSHTHMQLQQACFKMCGKREKKKLKQEKRAKLHFRRRRRCCRSSIATCSSQSRCRIQWRAVKGDLYFPLSLSLCTPINGQPPTQRPRLLQLDESSN